jgi:hypothetical protein
VQSATALAGAVQTFPHAPQLFRSALVGMHVPLHAVKPGSHWTPQLPPVQTAAPFGGTAHAVPQMPQFAVFVRVSTQAPPHGASPPVQIDVQVPEEQTSFAPHAWPQPPQLNGSFEVSTHPLPHLAKPEPQVKSQPVGVQIAVPFAGALQAFVQLPQFAGSMLRSRQLPLHGERPGSQVMPHWLA